MGVTRRIVSRVVYRGLVTDHKRISLRAWLFIAGVLLALSAVADRSVVQWVILLGVLSVIVIGHFGYRWFSAH